MNRFVMDLRGIQREGSFPLLVSYAGYLPEEMSTPKMIRHPTVNFELILSSSTDMKMSCKVDGEPLDAASVPLCAFHCPGLLYETILPEDKGREVFYFSYNKSLLGHFEFFRADKANYLFEIDSLRFAPLAGKAIELCKDIHSFGNADRLDRVCESIVNELVLSRKERGKSNSNALKAVRAIASHIELHFREEIALASLLEKHGVSKRTFLRHWGALFNCPPGKYIERLKVNEACRLLAEPGVAVGEVAAKLGFSDPFYFSRFFRKHKGMAPSEFRPEQ